MSARTLHILHLLIRRAHQGQVRFLVYPFEQWRGDTGTPYLILPATRTVTNPMASFLQGRSLEVFIDAVCREDLGLADDQYVLEQELESCQVDDVASPNSLTSTCYMTYPVDVWVDPAEHSALQGRVNGQWLTCQEAIDHPDTSPTARAVFERLLERDAELTERYQLHPEEELKPEAPRRLLKSVPAQPHTDALAKKWLNHNQSGIRHLPKRTLDRILDTGDHAFNLRVADPYLRYQMQGLGFTWSFFTHKDRQDTHVHGSPVVEIYGVLEGRMEIWSKPYHDRGTSAWNHRILEAGDWVEVDSLQCHIAHWLTEGKGVVFKAGPGPLAEVGKLGVKGKTRCDDCPCVKPPEVIHLEKT